jgi:hypothetical protein
VDALVHGLSRKWISLNWEAGTLSGPQTLSVGELGTVSGTISPIKLKTENGARPAA